MAYIVPKSTNLAKIKVVGVGGGGQNAVDSMIELNQTDGVEFIAMNTDLQVLDASRATLRIQLGPVRTHGLGSGADPQVGFEAATESIEEIKAHLAGVDMVFVAAGLGGGTGTGAAPVVAKVAKDLGALTVGVVTKPFDFEGKRRLNQAEQGIRELKDKLDALIVIPNQKLLEVVDENMPLREAFKVADQVIGQAVEGISDLITSTGLVNVDFADVKSIMSNAGSALMGIGYASGDNRAEKAAKGAINSPLLDVDIKGCTGLLINIVGDDSLSMYEVNTAANIISQSAHEGANIIFGANIDPEVNGIKITVIATGFDSDFKSVGLPREVSPIKNEDVIEQIDSRFDEIQQTQQRNIDEAPSSIVYEERVETISYEDNFDEEPFNIEAMRKRVRDMEEEQKRSSIIGLGNFAPSNDDPSDNSTDDDTKKQNDDPKPQDKKRNDADIKSSGLWRFIKERGGNK